MTERGSFKNFGSGAYPVLQSAVHNIKLPLTYSEFTVHMQNQLKAGSFVHVGTRAGLSLDVQFFYYARAMN